MRATNRSRHVLALASVALLVACNALTGAGDLTVNPCDGCEEVEGGIRIDGDIADGAGPGPLSDGSTDAPAGDTSKEGPGGMLDPTFGTGGFVVIDPLVDPRAVAVRADGRIVVVGQGSGHLAAAAFTTTGALDSTFGTAGRVVKSDGSSSFGSAVAFDSQGRAVVGGTSITVTTVSTHFAYVVRIGASQADATFANNGSLRGSNGGQGVRGVVVTGGDGVVLAITGGNDFGFVRLTAAGAPDGAFGNAGAAGFSNVGGTPTGLVAQTDGFLIAGTGSGPGGQSLTAAKLSLTGQPVSSFGTLGKAFSKVGPNNNETGQALAAQTDGAVLIGGDYDPGVVNIRRVTAVTRLTSSGLVDATYATAGKAVLDFSEPLVGKETETTNTNLLLDASGRTLVVGNLHDKLNVGSDRFRGWIARLRIDGTLDPLFGTQGKLVIGTAPSLLNVRGAALQPDGKLVIVGVDNSVNKLFLARIITSTTL